MMEGLQKILYSKSKTFLAFCFCFIIGSAFASLGAASADKAVYLYATLFVLLFFAIIFWNKLPYRFFIFCTLFFVFGSLRFFITLPDCTNFSQLCYYNGKKVTVIGTVSTEPDVRTGEAKYTVAVSQVIEGEVSSEVKGKVLVTTRLYPAYAYGERVQILCSLKDPENRDEETFRYDKYLAKEWVWSICSFPKEIIVIPAKSGIQDNGDWIPGQARNDNGQGSFASAQDDRWRVGQRTMKKILRLKSKVQNQINRLWPEPESSLMAGLLYGSRSSIPQDLKDNFNKTGLTHIIAISGFNVTIIVVALMTALIYLGLWRKQAYWAVVIMTVIFVIFTGATASVTRAAVMGLLILTAQQIGRLSRIGNALVFTAAVMTIINPYVLIWDAGFQLSFLATMGLVYVSPILSTVIPSERRSDDGSLSNQSTNNRAIEQLNNKTIKVSQRFFASLRMTSEIIRKPLLTTLSAILVTLPLILYQFGRLSIVAPLVNVLVLWIIPLLMLVGFVAIIFSFIFFPLGQLIAWLAHFGLQYVIMLVEWFGSRDLSSVEMRIPLWGMLLMYVILIWQILRSEKLKMQSEK